MKRSLAFLVALALPRVTHLEPFLYQNSPPSASCRSELSELRLALTQSQFVFDYQLNTLLPKLLVWGTEHPDQVVSTVTCDTENCWYSLAFNGAPFSVEDYQTSRDNTATLLHKLADLRPDKAAEAEDLAEIVERTPVLIHLGNSAVLTLSHPLMVSPGKITYASLQYTVRYGQQLIFSFPISPTPMDLPSPIVAGYDLIGNNVRGSDGVIRSEGLHFNAILTEFTPRNNP